MSLQDIHAHRILILDFGSQYTQLIARRVREIGVYCEIHPWDMSAEDINAFAPRGVILAGGPESVHAAASPRAPQAVFDLNVPLFGICYGMQTMAEQLGGKPGEKLVTCERRGSGKHVYVWGDSHARHLLPGVAEAFPDVTVDILYYTSCLPQSGIGDYVYEFEGRKALADGCVARNRKALAMFETMAPTTIILSQYAGYEGDDGNLFLDASRILIDRLERAGHAVTWLGAVPYPDRDLGECSAVPATISNARLGLRCRGSEAAFDQIARRNAERARQFPDVYVDITPEFCPDGTYASCVWVSDGRPLFRDKHHITVDKSIAVIRAVRDRIGRPAE